MAWLYDNAPVIGGYAAAHAWYSLVPLVVGVVFSVPVGWLVSRAAHGRGMVLAIVGALYAIPSLPLLMVLPSILGTRILDPINLEVALGMYAVALMVQYCVDAFDSVDSTVLQSADAMGFGGFRRFWDVELPQAAPVILAGMRVVSVSTISLITVGSLIGVESLGMLFVEGYQRSFPFEILVGIVGTMGIAAAFDAALVVIGGMLMPWNRAVGHGIGERGRR
ncbi:ABC transporter permease [Bifidobacterium catulorum]|uniref:ABC transporter permease n=1 Tax=Bifidobacterium catulorum TaxID=1630173 RepID=UPI0019D4788C|nr:ABC transporter permease subunit [Bifidobacterium catulorum]